MAEDNRPEKNREFPENAPGTDDDQLAENISRVLSRAQLPKLDEQSSARMLAELKTRQQELFQEGYSDMATTASHYAAAWQEKPESKSVNGWLFILPTILLTTVLLGGFIYWSLSTQVRPDAMNGNIAQNGGTNEKEENRVKQKLGSFVERKLTRRELAEGTILIANALANYSIDGPRSITLNAGELFLIVSKSDEPFTVNTPEGEVRATGTRFSVSADKDSNKTSAAVAQGIVELDGTGGEIRLTAGQQGLLERDKQPTRQPAPRLSHLVSWAKEALAQEELLVEPGDKENGLVAIDPNGQESKLSLRKYHVNIYIEEGIARTTIDQTFFNHNPWNTEGTFYFPLPPDASVSRLAMYVAGTLNEGGMVSRERGQQIYNEILYQQRDPALLEMMEGNMFKMRIFPLEGRQEKRIFLSYTQKLSELYGTMRYWFPMDHTNSIAGEVSISVRVKDGAKNFTPQSSTHDVKVETDGDDLLLEYAQEKIKPDQDFLLHLIPEKKLDPTRVSVCEKDGKKFLFARIHPEITGEVTSEPRQWIVLNDVSASRTKIESEAQRYVLSRLIEEADDNDLVHLIDLNTRAIPVTVEPLSVRSKAAKKLGDHRMPFKIGACNIEAGIAAVKKAIVDHELNNPHLVYLGDGVATDGERDVSQLTGLLSREVPFIGIGIGKSVDAIFMQTAADSTGGMFSTINPDEDIDWRVFDLVAALNTPRMNKVEVLLFDKNNKPVNAIAYPSSRGLADGETLTVVARCDGDLPSELVFRGNVNGKTVAMSTDLTNTKKNAEFIPRLWAKRHIDELLKSDMPRQEEITGLSKQYYVVTPYTSLIVLEDDKMYEEFKVERGRKDHWALYDAPKTIEVVREEVDWRKWGWYRQGEDSKVATKAQPKTVQEIVDNMQLRINAPFYYTPPTNPIASRVNLYLLAESMLNQAGEVSVQDSSVELKLTDEEQKYLAAVRSRNNRLLAAWYLVSAGQQDLLRRPENDKDATSDSRESVGGTGGSIKQNKNLQWPMMMGGGGRRMRQPMFALDIGLQDEFGIILEREYLEAKFRGERFEQFGRPMLRARGGQLARSELLMPMVYAGTSSHGVQDDLHFSFQQAMQTRWGRINRDVENHNRQYSNWSGNRNWNSWNTGYALNNGIDLRRAEQTYWNDGLQHVLMEFKVGRELGDLPTATKYSIRELVFPEANLMAELDGAIPVLPGLMGFDVDRNGVDDSYMIDPDAAQLRNVDFMGVDFTKSLSTGLTIYTHMPELESPNMFGAQSDGWYYTPAQPLLEGFIADRAEWIDTIDGTSLQLPMQRQMGFQGRALERFYPFIPVRSMDRSMDGEQVEVFYERPTGKTRYLRAKPLFAYSSLARSQTNQPPMVSAIAADLLKERREELAKQTPDEMTQRELKLLDAALENVEASAAHIENSSPYWNGGWNYQPRIQPFQPPQIQAWPGYNWAYDLTRYADGLYTNSADILGEVAAEYGSAKPLGKISDEARNLIDAARAAVAPVRISSAEPHVTENSKRDDAIDTADRVELLVASGDRYALTTRNEMYLTERMICDGENIWQLYDELGIAARRDATELRLSSLRSMVPHLLPPADVLTMFHHVEVIDQDDESFTLKLTIAQQPKNATKTESETEAQSIDQTETTALKDESEVAEAVLIIRVDRTGRILEKSLEINSESILKVVFDYQSRTDHVSVKWLAMLPVESEEDESEAKAKNETPTDNEEEVKRLQEVGKARYAARSGMLLESMFNVEKETDEMVVIDMPLKRPQFYSDQISNLISETVVVDAESGKQELRPKDNLTDNVRMELIRLYRLHALSSIQELTWRRWNQECQPAKSSMLKVLELQKETGTQTRLGDVVLLGSSGAYGIQDLVKDYLTQDRLKKSTKNLTQLNRENVMVKFFHNSRNHGWQLEDHTFDDESGLLGHLAGFLKSNNWGDRGNLFEDFEKRFRESPLMLALVSRHGQQTGSIEPWLKLNDNPRWHGFALMMAAPYVQEGQQPQYAKAYWAWRDELKETKAFKAGVDLPMNAQISTILQTATPDQFNEMIDERLNKVKKTDSFAALIMFAEHAANWGIPETARIAMNLAEEKAVSKTEDGQMPLSIRQSLAEGYWTSNLYKPSLEHFDAMIAQLDAEKIAASPALLASAARVASLAGNNARALELEERALAIEHKYLPEMINLTAFNQRYNWLWQQYQQAIAGAKDDQRKIKQISTRAKDTWLRWQEVDSNNMNQASNIATMLKSAGADDQEIWQHLSTAIDRKPRDSASYVAVADWYQSQNNLDKAEQFLDEAYRWDTANPKLLFRRAEILESLKRRGDAVLIYKKIVEGEWAPALQGWAAKAKEKLKGIEEL